MVEQNQNAPAPKDFESFKQSLSAPIDYKKYATRNSLSNFGSNNQIVLKSTLKRQEEEFQSFEYDTPNEAIFHRYSDGTYQAKFKNYLGATGNEDRLGQLQSGWDQLANGVIKNARKMGNYILDNTVGTIAGVGNMIATGSLSGWWNNDVSKTIDEWNQSLDYKLPNHYTNEQKSMSVLRSLTTANFWANDFAGGIAFIGGSLLPELALGIMTGGATIGGSLAKVGLKSAAKNLAKKGLREGAEELFDPTNYSTLTKSRLGVPKQAFNTEKFIQSAQKVQELEGGLNVMKAAQKVKRYATAGSALDTGLFLTRSSGFEAGMEARHNFNESIENYINNFQAENGRTPTTDELSKFTSDAVNVANGVFGANMAVLGISNYAMFGRALGIKVPKVPATSSVRNVFNSTIGLGVKKSTEDAAKLTLKGANRVQKFAGNTYKIFSKPLAEGVYEEGFQGVIGKTMQNYMEGKYSTDKDATLDFTSSMYKAFGDQYGTKEGWKEMTVGMLVGFMGGAITERSYKALPGVGNNSRKAAQEALGKNVDKVNTGVNMLRNMNRASSAANFRAEFENRASEGKRASIEDSNINMSFIQSQESLKDLKTIEKDFNKIIDESSFEELGLDQKSGEVDQYKEQLKQDFQNDIVHYKNAKKLTDNLDINNIPLGDQFEVSDYMTALFFNAGKSTERANRIGKEIDELTGESGSLNALKTVASFNQEQLNIVEKLNQNRQKLQELKDLSIKYSTDFSTQQTDRTRSEKYKEYAQKVAITQKRILELEDENKSLTTTIEGLNNVQTDFNFGSTVSPTGAIDTLSAVEQVSRLEEYVDQLNKTGRTTEAAKLEDLLDDFKTNVGTSLQASIETSKIIAGAYDKTSKKGNLRSTQKIFQSILGPAYQLSEETKKEFQEKEEILRRSFNSVFTSADFDLESHLKAFEKNPNLSSREKYKLENQIRILLSLEKLQNINEKANQTLVEPTRERESVSVDKLPINSTVFVKVAGSDTFQTGTVTANNTVQLSDDSEVPFEQIEEAEAYAKAEPTNQKIKVEEIEQKRFRSLSSAKSKSKRSKINSEFDKEYLELISKGEITPKAALESLYLNNRQTGRVFKKIQKDSNIVFNNKFIDVIDGISLSENLDITNSDTIGKVINDTLKEIEKIRKGDQAKTFPEKQTPTPTPTGQAETKVDGGNSVKGDVESKLEKPYKTVNDGSGKMVKVNVTTSEKNGVKTTKFKTQTTNRQGESREQEDKGFNTFEEAVENLGIDLKSEENESALDLIQVLKKDRKNNSVRVTEIRESTDKSSPFYGKKVATLIVNGERVDVILEQSAKEAPENSNNQSDIEARRAEIDKSEALKPLIKEKEQIEKELRDAEKELSEAEKLEKEDAPVNKKLTVSDLGRTFDLSTRNGLESLDNNLSKSEEKIRDGISDIRGRFKGSIDSEDQTFGMIVNTINGEKYLTVGVRGVSDYMGRPGVVQVSIKVEDKINIDDFDINKLDETVFREEVEKNVESHQKVAETLKAEIVRVLNLKNTNTQTSLTEQENEKTEKLAKIISKLQQFKQRLEEVNRKIEEVTKKFDSQTAQKKAELKNLEQLTKEAPENSNNQSDIEAKRAEIDKRRQDELKQPISDKLQEIEKSVKTLNITVDKDGKLEQTSDEILTNIKSELDKIGLPYKEIVSNENGSSYKVITNDGTEIEVVKLLKTGGALLKPSLRTAKFINHLIKTEPQSLRDLISNKINAKYDAELEALKQPSKEAPENSNNQSNTATQQQTTRAEEKSKEQEAIPEEDMASPVTIVDTEGFKRFSELSSNEERTPEEEAEYQQLKAEIDDWTIISGITISGINLSDLIEQRSFLDSVKTEVTPIIEQKQELGDMDKKEKFQNTNYTFSLNYFSVHSTKNPDNSYTISYINPKAFLESIGVDIFTKDGSSFIFELQGEMHSITQDYLGNLVLPEELVSEINSSTDLRILSTTDGSYSVVYKFNSENVATPLKSNFNSEYNKKNQPVEEATIYQTKEGDKISFEIDPLDDYNVPLLQAYSKAVKSGKQEDIQKAKLDIQNKAVIRAVNSKRQTLGFLKGNRTQEGSKITKEDLQFLAMRIEALDSDELLSKAANTKTIQKLPTQGVKVSKVLIGRPNIKIERGQDNLSTVTNFDPIRVEDVSKVLDIGYIENGEIRLRNKVEASTQLITKIQEKSTYTKGKTPVVVLSKAGKSFIFPVRTVAIEPVKTEEFADIFYSDSMTETQKVIKLNKILVENKIDVNVKGNAFVTVGFNNLTEEFFNQKLNQILNSDRHKDINNWLDKKSNLESIITQEILLNLDINDPIHSPKIDFDFTGVVLKESATVTAARAVKTKDTTAENNKTATKVSGLKKLADEIKAKANKEIDENC